MSRRSADPKVDELARSRTLNPHPERVSEEAFATGEFFDARDMVQVKYEMVRKVTAEGVSVTAAADAFGMSRQSFYSAAAALESEGLAGLVPGKPGPRRAHKLSDEVLDYLAALRLSQPGLRATDLAEAVAQRFGISVHPRSVERAIARREATGSSKSGSGPASASG